MAIKLHQPIYLHKLGRRKNNEDSIYPMNGTASPQDRLFLVCDGVGGANKGEIASRMVCDVFAEYVNDNPIADIDDLYISDGLLYVEEALTKHYTTHPECAGMATTLTLIYFNDAKNKATVAWVGDSKIYHIRAGEILFESQDHSLVNELVKRGEITPDEAKVHPQRNVILRAISGQAEPSKADVVQITDVQAGDYFLLASDGITESIDNRILVTLLKDDAVSLTGVRDKIEDLCAQFSNDNHSMYLLQVADVVEGMVDNGKTAPIENYNQDAHATTALDGKTPSQTLETSDRKWLYALATLALFALLSLGVYKWLELRGKKQYQAELADADNWAKKDSLNKALSLYQNLQQKYPNNSEIDERIKALIVAKETKQQGAIQDSLLYVADSLLSKADSTITMKLDSSTVANYRNLSQAELLLLVSNLSTLMGTDSVIVVQDSTVLVKDSSKIKTAPKQPVKVEKDTVKIDKAKTKAPPKAKNLPALQKNDAAKDSTQKNINQTSTNQAKRANKAKNRRNKQQNRQQNKTQNNNKKRANNRSKPVIPQVKKVPPTKSEASSTSTNSSSNANSNTSDGTKDTSTKVTPPK